MPPGWDGRPTEDLFRELRQTDAPELREHLIQRHAGLVRHVAKDYTQAGEPFDDLVGVGLVGLINAVDRFDPERGTRFATFAVPTIKGEIRRHFRDRGWGVRVPRRIQELGRVEDKEMFRTFNMGVGFVLVVGRRSAARTLEKLKEQKMRAWVIGELTAGGPGVSFTS